MNKIILITLAVFAYINVAKADTIVILDDNNNIKQQIHTSDNYPTDIQTNSSALPKQEVIVTNPNRQPNRNNNHIPEFISGVTGAVVGSAIYDSVHHHHHH